MDATFDTNHMKFYLFTLMEFDDFRNCVPIAWIITSRQKIYDLIQWLTALRAKMITIQPEWHPSCFIVNDAIHEQNAIKYIIFPSVFHFALISFCFIYLAFTNKFIFCIDLCGGMKMFIYFCVRGTFITMEKNDNFKNQGRFFAESRSQ